ncbi:MULTISPECIES: acyl-CoA dehydrogenase family protein [unclassified Erythrobacter]|jgi:alkylation response protein AidB-like acyl-CoA dehydrogenase|uniref:acyl-CoA dehydrogenase family protein n=1 Tax=unclassified Erythrobacter TaxID=2633097 RepID=UPI0012A8D7A7|nr:MULTISPECIES: acyl-CoA dehydrogenase family protein [unclassified Erythrobacter]QFT77499.1 Acyl-CoA dehydrogenase [Erythrobacter sp. THAF29]
MSNINFLFNEDERMAIDGLRRYLDEQLEPELQKLGDTFYPKEKMVEWAGHLTQFGMINAPQPTEHGGLGMSWRLHVQLIEELAYSSADLTVAMLVNAAATSMVLKLGSDELRERYGEPLLNGKIYAAVGISEPGIGSDVSGVTTRAVRDDDDWVISGEKTWITNGEYSDIFICTCRTDDNQLTHILLDRNEHPYEVRGIPKMALNGQSTSQVFMDGVRVPVSNTVGDIGDGLKNTLTLFERARIHVGAWGYGIARRALAESIKYSQEREQHSKVIAGHQLIADKIATMATRIDAARLLALRAASMIDAGERCDVECAMAKWYGTEIAVDATRQAVQIHGGNGVTKEFIVERLAREAMITPIPDGTTEIQKLLIARGLTGVSAFK